MRRRQYVASHLFGFTVVEALVTLFIVAVVSTMVLANYRTGQQQLQLRQVTSEMVSALRDAQQHALGATCPSPCVTKPSGYGVHLDSIQLAYVSYADQDGDSAYDLPPSDVDALLPNQPPPRPSNVSLTFQLVGLGCGGGGTDIDIAFQPPLPTTSIKKNSGTVSCDKACIDLTLSGKTSRILVTANSGLIEVINNPGACS